MIHGRDARTIEENVKSLVEKNDKNIWRDVKMQQGWGGKKCVSLHFEKNLIRSTKANKWKRNQGGRRNEEREKTTGIMENCSFKWIIFC